MADGEKFLLRFSTAEFWGHFTNAPSVVPRALFFGFFMLALLVECSQPPDKPKLVGYAMKLDLSILARLAGLRAVRYKIVGIQVT